MNPTEQAACARQGAKPAAVPETGRFAVLCGLLGACGPRASKIIQGTSAPARKRSSGVSARWSSFTAVLVAAIFVLAAVGAAPASAAEVEHKFQSQITGLSLTEAFVHPWGLSFDATGNLYVADAEGAGSAPGALDVFGSAGTFTAKLDDETLAPATPFTGPYVRSVAVSNATGDVYVGESQCDCVQVLKPKVPGKPEEGYELLHTWTGAKTVAGFGSQFVYVAVNNSADAHAGDVYVLATHSPPAGQSAEGTVEVIKPGPSGEEGETVQELPVSGTGNEEGLSINPVTGDVYVAESSGRNAVEVFSVEGKLLFELVGTETPAKSFEPIDVAVAPATGEIYVVDGAHHVVDEFNKKSGYEGQITESEAEPGKPIPLVEPQGVAVNASGDVYVSDGGANAVDVYGPDLASAPSVLGESVSEITAESVTFAAEISPRSGPTEADTKYRFEYGPCTSSSTCASSPYGSSTPLSVLAPSFDFEPVSVPVQSLTAGTVYHFRVFAENGHGFDGQDTERVFTTQGVGVFALPDGREWEMVSPPAKNGALIEPINSSGYQGGVFHAAADGSAMTYMTNSPTEPEPRGYSGGVQVLSARGPGGWKSLDLAVPHVPPSGLSVGEGQEYRFFSEDLSAAVVQPFGVLDPAFSGEATEKTPFLRTNFAGADAGELCTPSTMHCYRPLVTAANATSGNPFGEEGHCEEGALFCGPEFVGASSDLSHVVLSSGVALTVGGGRGLYEWSGGKLSYIGAGVLGNGEQGPGAARHAISNDGSRAFFSGEDEHGNKTLDMRDMATKTTVQIDVPEAGCVKEGKCGEGNVFGVEFQAASSDGSRVFFMDKQSLTSGATAVSSSNEGGDLYECEIHEDACKLTDLGTSDRVLGSILGVSEDGSWVYFVSNGVLENNGVPVPGAVPGGCQREQSVEGQVCNLYVRHEGTTKLVAVIEQAEYKDWGPNLVGQTARVSPDGEWLAFQSQRSLTGYDNRDAVSGKPDEEVYLYNGRSGRLVCASCNPTGGRPHGVQYGAGAFSSIPLAGGNKLFGPTTWVAANVPGWTPVALFESLYQSRYLSDSGRLFFNSSDALASKDVNGQEDVYEYEPAGVGPQSAPCGPAAAGGSEVFKAAQSVEVEGRNVEEGAGCVALISSGASSEESAFLDASETGGDVFFMTAARLAAQDFDNALDVYDAHECSSVVPCSAAPTTPPPCVTAEGCRAAPVPQPASFGAPSSATFSGIGDVVQAPAAPAIKPKTAKCKKGLVRKRGRCVRSKAKKKTAKKSAKGAKRAKGSR